MPWNLTWVVQGTDLMRAVHVVQADHGHWQLVASHVRHYKHLSSCLAGRVWVGGSQDAALEQVRASLFHLAVHLLMVSFGFSHIFFMVISPRRWKYDKIS